MYDMWQFFIVILFFSAFLALVILHDWLVYKLRGRVKPDSPDDTNSSVITGPEDANAQRLGDLYTQDK